jgi:hypothetical protein
MHKPRSHLLSSATLVLLAGLVLLAACNTSSVSGTQQKPSNTTAAETKAASSPGAGRQAQGAIGAALANTR